MRVKGWGLTMVAGAALMMGTAGAAQAAPVTLCMKPGQPVVAPSSAGTCATGFTATRTASDADLQATRTALTAATARISALEATLAGVTRSGSLLRFSAVNVRIDNGAGASSVKNGLGNLIVGFNEAPGAQTGSHNVIVGRNHSATGYGGLLVGSGHTNSGAFATTLGYATRATAAYAFAAGDRNTASGQRSSAIGGSRNTAVGFGASITGGMLSHANSRWSAITGGCGHLTNPTAESPPRQPDCDRDPSTSSLYKDGEFAAVTGGRHNNASGKNATVTAGSFGIASGDGSAVTGGGGNTASGFASAVTGGAFNTAGGGWSAVTGGEDSTASGGYSAVTGGVGHTASGGYSAVTGGSDNTASGGSSAVTGGRSNHATDELSAILGGPNVPSPPAYGTYPAGP